MPQQFAFPYNGHCCGISYCSIFLIVATFFCSIFFSAIFFPCVIVFPETSFFRGISLFLGISLLRGIITLLRQPLRGILLLCSGNHYQQRPNHNPQISNIKNNIPQPFISDIKAEIVHHIFSFQPVISIAESPAQHQRQSAP